MPLTEWISEGITVEIIEAEVMADLDFGFLSGPDRRSAVAEQ